MWDVKPGGEGGVWGTIKHRFFSFGMVLAAGFLLLVSLMISAALAALGKFFGGFTAHARARAGRDQFCGFPNGRSRVIRANL
jgi:membrane protein